MSSFRIRYYLVKLKMLELEDKTAADMLDEWVNPATLFDEDADTKAADLEAHLRSYEEKYKSFSTMPNRKQINLGLKNLQRSVIEDFKKKCVDVKKCENCGGFSPSYRKDGYSKIFQKPMSKKMKKQMAAMRLKLKVECIGHVVSLF